MLWRGLQSDLNSSILQTEMSQNFPQVDTHLQNIVLYLLFLIQSNPWPAVSRLLLLLGVADLVHLVTSLLSFSLPTLSPTFHTHSYLHTLPFTLPLAQVKTLNSTTKNIISPCPDEPGDVGVPYHLTVGGALHLCDSSPGLHPPPLWLLLHPALPARCHLLHHLHPPNLLHAGLLL